MAVGDLNEPLLMQEQHYFQSHQQQHHHQHQHQKASDHAESTPAPQYDDASSPSSSCSSPCIPYASYEVNDHLDDDLLKLEHGYLFSTKSDGDKGWAAKGWWGGKDSRVHQESTPDRRHDARSRRSARFHYCIFGGISGLGILAILLSTNLLLTLVSLYWTTDPDDIFKHWGGIASGTEGLSWYPTDFTRDIQPIPCHSHNDYWRRVPLFSALRAGCTGVEADVWLRNGDLFVGHNTASLTRNRTFASLYIDPIVRILERQNPTTEFHNGTANGVFDVDPAQTLTLLIDVKTSGVETWPWILKQLEPLRSRGWLSFVEGEMLHTRPVTVVGTGNTRFDILTQNETYRDIFFDAPLSTMWEPRHAPSSPTTSPPVSSPFSDIDPITALVPISEDTPPPPTAKLHSPDLGQGLSGTSPTSQFTRLNSYYASASLTQAIGHIWRGRLSDAQMKIIRGQVRGAHARGLKARYWDLPAWPLGLRNQVWDVLVREGVDVLNVDDVRAAGRVVW